MLYCTWLMITNADFLQEFHHFCTEGVTQSDCFLLLKVSSFLSVARSSNPENSFQFHPVSLAVEETAIP